MKKLVKLITKVGEVSAKNAVTSASPFFCYQAQEPKAATKKFAPKA